MNIAVPHPSRGLASFGGFRSAAWWKDDPIRSLACQNHLSSPFGVTIPTMLKFNFLLLQPHVQLT